MIGCCRLLGTSPFNLSMYCSIRSLLVHISSFPPHIEHAFSSLKQDSRKSEKSTASLLTLSPSRISLFSSRYLSSILRPSILKPNLTGNGHRKIFWVLSRLNTATFEFSISILHLHFHRYFSTFVCTSKALLLSITLLNIVVVRNKSQ